MAPKKRINYIVRWIKDYARQHGIEHLVVGVSGGIDSAVVSTLCAQTGLDVSVLSMPIRQSDTTQRLSQLHMDWLVNQFPNVTGYTVNLTPVFDEFESTLHFHRNDLSSANSRSRLRMMTLYHVAQAGGGIVVGTGNKVEDFGVGFFTKYGDGGVDISPIGDCLKTEVWAMGRSLGIPQEIIDAPPTDGLWDDGRTDEDQLGMPYPDLEKAMQDDENNNQDLDADRQAKLETYRKIRARNLHKMEPIPVCKMPDA